MLGLPSPMLKRIRELTKLPSIGEKTATRLAYHLLTVDPKLATTLGVALNDSVASIRLCENCFFLTDAPLCSICTNPSRDSSILCVLEKPMDLVAIERMGDFKGHYHVLHGLWAPLRGMGPESMKLNELVARLQKGTVKEVILATGSTVEGDATALYVGRLVSDLGIPVSRLAQGMPKGGELEYADEITLSRALAGRQRL